MQLREHNRLAALGVIVPRTAVLLTDEMREENPRLAMDALAREFRAHAPARANDAVPTLITTPNAGIPAYLANYVDPEEIRVITQPNKSEEAYGSTQKGNWTTFTTEFRVIESTGYTSAYGDYAESGRSGHNVNYVYRQSWHFQTFAEWGEREVDIEALAGVAYISEQNVAAAINLDKFRNKANFYGIAGLTLYGALNDPALFTPITPTTKTGGPSTTQWGAGTPPEQIFADVQALFAQLQSQMGGNARMSDAMTLVLSPTKEVYLTNANSFGTLTAEMYIRRAFPNLTIVTAPEMATQAGELMQLRLNKVDGKDTTYCGFTERMRNHAIIQRSSSWAQKKSAGTWGFIMRYPIALAQMLGI